MFEMLDKAMLRPANYNNLPPDKQWEIDKELGILDWDPTPEDQAEYKRRRKEINNTYPEIITPEWLKQHPECLFIYGDNQERRGKKGAAICRDEPNAYGFITQRYPSSDIASYFKPINYMKVLEEECTHLRFMINQQPDKIFLISKLGGGLANKFNIRPMIIQALKEFESYPNVVFLGGNS